MKTFLLHLQSGLQYEKVEDVVSFIGCDATGTFGLLAGHERMMTILGFGLARFRVSGGTWHYIALPGGVVYFVDNELYISTHRFVHGNNYSIVAAAISDVLAKEEEIRHDFKSSISRMEQEMTRRLWQLQRERG
ncbi:MAG: hypothetical protein COB49_12940 [Alphaproteobacteria bacterium]|nr:MAG: hypothetical protein COB49_12940 [Alphaproteobacteria bacterium]